MFAEADNRRRRKPAASHPWRTASIYRVPLDLVAAYFVEKKAAREASQRYQKFMKSFGNQALGRPS